MRRVLVLIVLLAAVGGGTWFVFRGPGGAGIDLPGPKSADSTRNCGPGPNEADGKGYFTDITAESGIDFERVIGPLGTYFLPEINGSGGAVFDFDGDGLLDIYLLNCGRSPKATGDLPTGSRIENRLYRQTAGGRFVDVTADSGTGDTGYGIGCAVGDVDNDGDLDLFLANYGRDRLLANNGDGTFTDVTDAVGLETVGWATCAAFVDYDRDGWLDLVIVRYGSDEFNEHKSACDYGNSHVGYCSPLEYTPAVDILLHNEGLVAGGPGQPASIRFRDVSKISGIDSEKARGTGFAVVCADFNGDHWPDLYIANDMYENRLWINQADGTFRDDGVRSGAGMNFAGKREASMGLAVGDVDNDGDFDILSTHFTDETNTLYLGDGRGDFHDATEKWQLGLTSRRHTGWGAAFIDLDHDGHLDLPLVNGLALPCEWRTSSDSDRHGAEVDIVSVAQREQARVTDPRAYWAEYADRNQLYINNGAGRFEDHTPRAGDFATNTASGRGLIFGDLDNDGDFDLIVTTCDGPVGVYRNDMPKRGHWLQLKLIDPARRRDAYGAELVVVVGDKRYHRVLNPAGSYLTSNDVRVHVGLGQSTGYDRIEVVWPDGRIEVEHFGPGLADRLVVLKRDEGTVGDRPQ